MTIERLTRKDFTDLAPGSLVVQADGAQVALTVTELHDLPPVSPRAEPFAVTLEGPRDPLLPQGIYGVLHPQYGRLDLFIVPIARDNARSRYEMIFN